MTLDNQIKNYNYRVNVLFKNHLTGWEKRYTVEFPEFWLAMKYIEALQDNEDIVKIYLLERISDGSFDITRRFK